MEAKDSLKRPEATLIVLLASGYGIAEAARQVGMSESTVYRRRRKPEFLRSVAVARAELVNEASGVMSAAMTEAATTLRELLKAESDAIRLGAARAVLELGHRLRELVELDERIRVLEDAAAKVKTG